MLASGPCNYAQEPAGLGFEPPTITRGFDPSTTGASSLARSAGAVVGAVSDRDLV